MRIVRVYYGQAHINDARKITDSECAVGLKKLGARH